MKLTYIFTFIIMAFGYTQTYGQDPNGYFQVQNPFDSIRVLRLDKIEQQEEIKNLRNQVRNLQATNGELNEENQALMDSLVNTNNRINAIESKEVKTREEKNRLKRLYNDLETFVKGLEAISSSQRLIIRRKGRELMKQEEISGSYKNKYLSNCSRFDLVVKGHRSYVASDADYQEKKLKSIGVKMCYALEYEDIDMVPKTVDAEFKFERIYDDGSSKVIEQRNYQIERVDGDEHIIFYESDMIWIERKELRKFEDGWYKYEFKVNDEIIKTEFVYIGKQKTRKSKKDRT